MLFLFFFFKPTPQYELRFSDWISDVCSSDLGIRDSGFGIRDSSKRERHITCVIPNPQSPIPNPGPQGITGGTYVSVNPSTHSNPRTSGICTSSCRKEIGRAPCRERVCQYV